MGNMLTFMDIYEKSKEAGSHGDFLSVVYELSRLIRRCVDFKSMERGTLLSSAINIPELINSFIGTNNKRVSE